VNHTNAQLAEAVARLWRQCLCASTRGVVLERGDQWSEHLAVDTHRVHRDELCHVALKLPEQVLEIVELSCAVKLASQRVADVQHAAAGTVSDIERAAAWSAEHAARVEVIAARRNQIGWARAGERQSSDLVIVEQLGRDAGTTRTACVASVRRR
jgi:hypothetical protein